MVRVRARAHASIANLGYGFDVFAVCVAAGSDSVEIVSQGRHTRVEVTSNGGGPVPTAPGRNTASVAVERLMRDFGIARALLIRIDKGVPTGGGLGSSAASAAAAVVAADRLFGLRLPRHRLVPYAAHGETASAGVAHADNVAASLFGDFVIVEKRDPENLVRIAAPKTLRFVIATPRLTLTTEAARRALPRRIALEEHSQGCGRAGMIVAAMMGGNVRELGRAIEGSSTDRARASLVPGFSQVCHNARSAGAAGATLSGAGPSVMAVVDAAVARAVTIAGAMRDGFAAVGLEAETRIVRVAGKARVIEAS